MSPWQPHHYFKFSLKCAKRIYDIRCSLQDSNERRQSTIKVALSEWQGEERDHFKSLHDQSLATFDDCVRSLQHFEDVYVEDWVNAVDEYNQEARSLAIARLQPQLDAYHYELERQDTIAGAIRGGITNVGDELVELVSFGSVNLKKDEAGPLVPHPRKVRDVGLVPRAPDFAETRVFVNYFLVNPGNPTYGMDDDYSTRPS